LSVCDVPVIATICENVGEGAASLITTPFEWLADAMGNLAKFMFETVWKVIESTTALDLTSSGYRKVYALVFGIGVFLMLGFFLLQLLTGLARREPGATRRAVTGLAKSVLGSAVALTIIGLLLTASDQIAAGLVSATGNTMQSLGARLTVLVAGGFVFSLTSPGASVLLSIFLSSLAICATVIVWFSLIIRKSLLLVAIVLAPIALSGQSWDTTKSWLSKWASFVIAMTISKITLILILLVGVTQVGSPLAPDLQSISEPIAGVVLLLVAGFAPYMTYKLTAFMGADIYHLMSAEQEAKHALNRPIPVAAPRANPSTILDGGTPTEPGLSGGDGASTAGPSVPGSPGSGSGGGSAASTTTLGATGVTGAGATSGAGASSGASAATVGGAGAAASGAAAGGGAAAAAGPVAPIVLGAQAAVGAAKAGPAAGNAIGSAANNVAGTATASSNADRSVASTTAQREPGTSAAGASGTAPSTISTTAPVVGAGTSPVATPPARRSVLTPRTARPGATSSASDAPGGPSTFGETPNANADAATSQPPFVTPVPSISALASVGGVADASANTSGAGPSSSTPLSGSATVASFASTPSSVGVSTSPAEPVNAPAGAGASPARPGITPVSPQPATGLQPPPPSTYASSPTESTATRAPRHAAPEPIASTLTPAGTETFGSLAQGLSQPVTQARASSALPATAPAPAPSTAAAAPSARIAPSAPAVSRVPRHAISTPAPATVSPPNPGGSVPPPVSPPTSAPQTPPAPSVPVSPLESVVNQQ